MHDLLVYLDTTPASRHAGSAALELAQRVGARVLGMFVVAPTRMPGYVAAEIPQSALDRIRDTALEEARQQQQAFRDEARDSGVEVEWLLQESDAVFALNRCARAVDLVVLAQPEGSDPTGSRPLVDEVVLGSGRPVMVVPRAGAPVGFGEHVLVAWNGSREATTALHESMPLLRAANRVLVAAADSGDGAKTDLDSIIAHLGRHGVAAETRRLQAGASKAGDALLGLAAEQGIDLLVMGAWGHSRMREMVLGGATAHVLRHAALPVIMAH